LHRTIDGQRQIGPAHGWLFCAGSHHQWIATQIKLRRKAPWLASQELIVLPLNPINSAALLVILLDIAQYLRR